MAEQQRQLIQQQSQVKAQVMRQEDELARKRLQVSSGISFSYKFVSFRMVKLHRSFVESSEYFLAHAYLTCFITPISVLTKFQTSFSFCI